MRGLYITLFKNGIPDSSINEYLENLSYPSQFDEIVSVFEFYSIYAEPFFDLTLAEIDSALEQDNFAILYAEGKWVAVFESDDSGYRVCSSEALEFSFEEDEDFYLVEPDELLRLCGGDGIQGLIIETTPHISIKFETPDIEHLT